MHFPFLKFFGCDQKKYPKSAGCYTMGCVGYWIIISLSGVSDYLLFYRVLKLVLFFSRTPKPQNSILISILYIIILEVWFLHEIISIVLLAIKSLKT